MRTLALLKHWAIFSAPLLCILAALWLGFDAEPDVAVYFKEHSTNHPAIRMAFQFLTDWSNPVFYVIYGWMLLKAFRNNDHEGKRYVIILLIVQGIVAALAVHFIKHTIGRPRPGQGTFFEPLTTRGSYHAFPSGHTTEITGWALPMALRQGRLWLTATLALLIGAVGFSRIYLGWHHPSDVFFGWLLGSFGGFATTIIADSTLFRKKA